MRGNSHNGKKCSNKAHRKKKIIQVFCCWPNTYITVPGSVLKKWWMWGNNI